jgi:hypothetical protein
MLRLTPLRLRLTLSLLSAHARHHRQWRWPQMLYLTPRLLRLKLSPLSAHARRNRRRRRQHQSMRRHAPCWLCLPLSPFGRTCAASAVAAAPLDAASRASPAAPDTLIAQRARTPLSAVAAAASVDAAARALLAVPDASTVQRARAPPPAVAGRRSILLLQRHGLRLTLLPLSEDTRRHCAARASHCAPDTLIAQRARAAIRSGSGSISRCCGARLACCARRFHCPTRSHAAIGSGGAPLDAASPASPAAPDALAAHARRHRRNGAGRISRCCGSCLVGCDCRSYRPACTHVAISSGGGSITRCCGSRRAGCA